MNIAAIGVGGAGGRIVDRLARELGTDGSSPLATVHAIDTDTEQLGSLDHIPGDARHGAGQFETGGDGTDGDRELAAEVIEAERTQLRRAVEDGIATTVDAIVLVAGLAGGTGSAVTPALTAGLAKIYEQPVYTVSILPAAGETDEQRRRNTAQALAGLDGTATAQIVFDNDAWLADDESIQTHRSAINGELTERLGQLLVLGQETGTAVGERAIDTRDVMRTLEGGHLVTLGYASREIAAWRGASSSLVDGLKRRILGDDTDEYDQGVALQRTLRWATRGTLTFECPREAATDGLLVFRGSPEWLRGDAIVKGREWITEWAGIERLRTGDIPVSGADSLDVFAVFAGIQHAPRIEAFRETADSGEPAEDGAGEQSTGKVAEDGESSTEAVAEDGDPSTEEIAAGEESSETAEVNGEGEPSDTEETDRDTTSSESGEPSEWGVAPGESGFESVELTDGDPTEPSDSEIEDGADDDVTEGSTQANEKSEDTAHGPNLDEDEATSGDESEQNEATPDGPDEHDN